MRLRYSLLTLAAALLATTAAAQDYGVVTQTELAAASGTTAPEPRCVLAMDGSFVFYDSASGDVVVADPSDPGTFLTKADIDAAAGFEVDRCLAVFFQSEGDVARTFFAFGSGTGANEAERPEVVLMFDGNGDTLSRLVAPDQAAGTYALAASGSALYLGRVQFRGAPEDGFYRVMTTGGDQTPDLLATDGDLDLLDMDVASDGSVYAVSSEFGTGSLKNAIVRLTDPQSSPMIETVFAPCGGSVPGFAACDDGGIEEIEVVEIDGREIALVSNNQFTADVVVGAFTLDGTFVRTAFSGNALLADDDIEETTFSVAFDNYMAYDAAADRLYITGRARTATDAEALYFAQNPLAVANERDVVAAGLSISLANPVGASATVRYTTGAPGTARLEAFDLLGRRVALIADGAVSGDTQTAVWNTASLPSGVYVLRLATEAGAVTRTVSVVR